MKTISRILVLFVCFALLAPYGAVAVQIKWQKLESSHFVVLYEKAQEGRKILEQAESTYPRITSDFDYYPVKKTKIYVYHSNSLFLSGSPSGITGAYSQPLVSKIFINATEESSGYAVAHEVSHIVFLQSLPDPSKIPFWFVEGIAIYESQIGERLIDVEYPASPGDVDSISSLSKQEPKGIEEQRKVATTGYLIIDSLVDRYGKDGLKRLIKNLQGGADMSIALEKSFGVSEEELTKQWYEYIEARSRQARIQNLQYFGILALAVFVVIASVIWIMRRRRERQELEQESIEEDLEPLNPLE